MSFEISLFVNNQFFIAEILSTNLSVIKSFHDLFSNSMNNSSISTSLSLWNSISFQGIFNLKMYFNNRVSISPRLVLDIFCWIISSYLSTTISTSRPTSSRYQAQYKCDSLRIIKVIHRKDSYLLWGRYVALRFLLYWIAILSTIKLLKITGMLGLFIFLIFSFI